ncbi:uncharacterized protein LOC123506647 [Portunus trituberculatus]|uniref:uncharacterized protein LOC123506647 n=1 Tax=Portunus trituberculatus TaxID=210409 RepID=UPI001E1D1C23|nr:uncharacterized protein LOC123506647 [Portunus trituberculatus]
MDDGDRTIIILALGGSLREVGAASARKRTRAVASGDNEADCDTSDTSPHLTSLIHLLLLHLRRLSRSASRIQVPACRETQKAPLETPAGELKKKTSAGEGGRRRRTTHVGTSSAPPWNTGFDLLLAFLSWRDAAGVSEGRRGGLPFSVPGVAGGMETPGRQAAVGPHRWHLLYCSTCG